MQNDIAKGLYKYIPNDAFVTQGVRTSLVKEIFYIGKKVNQSQSTVHLAVKHLDRVFSACTAGIDHETYKLIANGCLMLAAKFDELDMNIPLLIDVQVANRFKLSYEMLKAIEGELLMILDFDFMSLTPYTVLTQLFASGVVFASDNK